MSLINQMLKDIERRRNKAKGGGAAEEEPSMEGVQPPTSPKRKISPILPVLTLVAVGVGIWDGAIPIPGLEVDTSHRQVQKRLAPSPRLPVSRIPVPERQEQSPPAEVSVAAPPAATLASAPTGAADKASTSSPATGRQSAAESPAGSGAITSAPSKTIDAAPELLQVRLGTHEGRLRLVAEFDRIPRYHLEVSQDTGRVRLLGDWVRPTGQGLRLPPNEALRRFETFRQEELSGVELELDGLREVRTFVLPAAQGNPVRLVADLYLEPQAAKQQAVSPAPRALPPVLPPAPLPQSRLTKTVAEDPSAVSRRLFDLAKISMEQGKTDRAEELLQESLAFDPKQLGAREMLSARLMEQNRTEELIPLLEDGVRLFPKHHPFRLTLARLLFDRGDVRGADQLLRQGPLPPVQELPDAYALLAAILQQKGDYEAASILYRRLSELWPERGLWWMGLGIALESRGDRAEAFEAYRQALSRSDLGEELNAFVLERLAAQNR